MKQERRSLTAYERESAHRLRLLWEEKRRREGLKLQDAADAMKISPSAISQYVRGKIPLNIKAIIRFAAYLGCDTAKIDPDDFFSELLTADERALLATFRALDRRGKGTMLDVAQGLSAAALPTK